jgi:hypothetical protein
MVEIASSAHPAACKTLTLIEPPGRIVLGIYEHCEARDFTADRAVKRVGK